ncbi:MAG: hypothetical protein H8E33_03475 [Candidatus Cloacimonetes bacterium]|nr:hypothetical protein [Candidatus Cloacimonadota bacterium]
MKNCSISIVFYAISGSYGKFLFSVSAKILLKIRKKLNDFWGRKFEMYQKINVII